MRQEKMRLNLIPSKEMDRVASENASEHEIVRLPSRARVYYNPSEDWDKIYILVRGAQERKLRIKQAWKKDLAALSDKNTDSIGFVTTKTYNAIVKKGAKESKEIWISEDKETIVIGCDPEFVIVDDTGAAVYADNILNTNGNDKWAALGSDGPCAELRPGPSQDVDVVIKNIRNLLRNSSKAIEEYRWIGGASFRHASMNRRYNIGGHLHFGKPNDIGANHEIEVQRSLCRVLDDMVGIPLIRIDTPMPEERRKEYGKFGEVKVESHKVEWRVPSGIWLVHPTIAKAVLTTSKAVAEEVWKRYKDRDLDANFMLQANTADNILKSFSCFSHEKTRELINGARISSVPDQMILDFHSKYKKMSTYHRYKDEIDLFIRLCCSKKMPMNEKNLELRNGWLENKNLPL